MANKKISSLTSLGATPAVGDILPITDISDTTGSVNGTTKKVTVANLVAAAPQGDLVASNNLSDVSSAATARTNLGLGTAATTNSTDYATSAQGTKADTATQPGDLGTAASQDVGTSANNVVQLDGSAKLPAVDGSQLTGITATDSTKLAITSNLSDLNNVTTARTNLGLGTAATKDAGTANGNLVELDSTGLPAVDGSQLTGITSTDSTKLAISNNLSDLANATTARTNLGLGSAATLTAGTLANNVVQLDSSAKLPAVDGSQLTSLPSGTLSYAAQTYTASGTPLAFTLTSAAQGKVVTVNESNNVYVTIPTGLGSGFNCKFVQLGTGKVVLQAGSGTTLNSYKTGTEILNTTIGQYAEIELVPVTTDSYVVVGNSTTAPFVNTYSVTLDGTNDYVNYGTFSALNSTASFTISAWIKTSTSGRMIFSGSSNDRMSLNATGVQFRVGGTSANIGTGNYDDGNWHQITAVYNAGTVTIYADGSSTADGSSSSYPTSTSASAYNTFRIGQVANAYYFNGVIDEFAVWSSALSSSEIPDIQASNAPIDLRSDNGNYTSSSNLINYWRMGDNDGGSGTTVTDLVGSLDGTLTNGASFTADTP